MDKAALRAQEKYTHCRKPTVENKPYNTKIMQKRNSKNSLVLQQSPWIIKFLFKSTDNWKI